MLLRSRTLSILVLTVMLASLFAGCFPFASGSQKTLTIAVAEANPGSEAEPDAQSIYAGAKLAADQVNAVVGGNIRVVVVPYADNNDPIKAGQVASTIVNSKAVAVIGHSSIETGRAASDIYDAVDIPVLNVVPVTEDLITQHESQFSVTYTVESEAAYLANYLARIDEKFSAGIIHTNSPESEEDQIQFRDALALLGGVVAFREQIVLPVVVNPVTVQGQSGSAATSSVSEPGQTDATVTNPVGAQSGVTANDQPNGQEQTGGAVDAQLKEIVDRMAEIPVGQRPKVLFVAADAKLIEQLKKLMDDQGISIPVSGLELLEGAELANLIGKRQASIIATNDEYGLALSKQFRNSFRGLGGEIVVDRVVSKDALSDELGGIFSEIISKANGVPLFIAMDDSTAADVFVQMKRKGIAAPVLGPSSLSSKVFRDVLADKDEEKVSRGYFTNGILTTRALIFDSANRYASLFLDDYKHLNPDENDPGDKVVNGYDAVMVLVTAAQRSGLAGTTEDSRKALLKALLQMDDPDASAQGLASPIFFEPSRLSSRVARFGVYQSGNVVSANVQFEPIFNPNEVKDLQEQVQRRRIMTVNGRYVYKANVVYSGIDLLGIDEIDIKNSTYKMDFYLWFRYRPNERDADFKPDEFIFTNAEDGVEVVPVREETNADGTVLKAYRVNGTFKNQFRFQAYPFEHQNLIVEFRNQNATTSYIQYVVDRSGMRIAGGQDLLKNYRENGAFASLYGWQEAGVQVAQDIFPTFSTFGSPQNFDRTLATNYSLINVNVDIQRDSLQYIVKSLLPLLITLILAYITFFLPLGHSERLAVGSTALLTTAFFHLQLADSLPEIGYTVAMEYLFYASYIMSALMVLLETLSIRYEKTAEDSKKKQIKTLYGEKRERLNTLGRIVYPSVFAVVVLAGVLVYFGVISLDARTADVQRLAKVAVAVEPEGQGNESISTTTQGTTTGQIKLDLNTWRPEDEAQIKKLLDEFHAYALTQGQDIVIEHKPVVSTNYDSILDQQLARGKDEPDLFYVRPYSVDGSIAKYLLPLTPTAVDVKSNYDENRIVPWMNRNKDIMAVPYVGVVQGIYYNVDLLNAMKLQKPQTWDGFLTILKKIQDDGSEIIPIANALNATEDSEMFMSIAANFLGGPDGRAKLMQTDGNSQCYNGASVLESFEALANLKQYLPPDAATITSQKSKELFFDGKALMLFGGSWDLQAVREKAEFNWDVMPVPGETSGSTYVIFQPDVGIGINRDSPNQAAAQLFLNWLMSKEAVDLTATNLAGFYPLNKLDASDTDVAKTDQFLNLVQEYPTDIRWMFTEISNEYPRADAIIRGNLYAMFKDDMTPTEAAQNLQNGLGEWYEPAQNCHP